MPLTDADMDRLHHEVFSGEYIGLEVIKHLPNQYLSPIPDPIMGRTHIPFIHRDTTFVAADSESWSQYDPFRPADVQKSQLLERICMAVHDGLGNVAQHVVGLNSGKKIPVYSRWEDGRGLYVVEGEPFDIDEVRGRLSKVNARLRELNERRKAGEDVSKEALGLWDIKQNGFTGGFGGVIFENVPDASAYTKDGRFLLLAFANDPYRND